MKKTVLALFLILMAGFSLHGLFWPGSGQASYDLDVLAGMTATQVAETLQQDGMIWFQMPFLIWTRCREIDKNLAPGRYRFSSGRSAFWIVDDMVHHRYLKVRLVIPEGFSSWQIAERVESLGLAKADDFRRVVAERQYEGFLFPATYELSVGLGADGVAERLRAQFNPFWTADMDARAQELHWTVKEVVTMASILEREVRVRDELPLISAVYHNRLRKKMRLEADPTVQYALGHWKKHLTYDDYRKTNSPYNTYQVFGLPPGPICSPGADAVKAALWPAESNALFLLAEESGRHTYSATYREHTNKVNQRNRRLKMGR